MCGCHSYIDPKQSAHFTQREMSVRNSETDMCLTHPRGLELITMTQRLREFRGNVTQPLKKGALLEEGKERGVLWPIRLASDAHER